MRPNELGCFLNKMPKTSYLRSKFIYSLAFEDFRVNISVLLPRKSGQWDYNFQTLYMYIPGLRDPCRENELHLYILLSSPVTQGTLHSVSTLTCFLDVSSPVTQGALRSDSTFLDVKVLFFTQKMFTREPFVCNYIILRQLHTFLLLGFPGKEGHLPGRHTTFFIPGCSSCLLRFCRASYYDQYISCAL